MRVDSRLEFTHRMHGARTKRPVNGTRSIVISRRRSVDETKNMRLAGSGLRTIVVTLDPKRNESQPDAPAAMMRKLGHRVDIVGYDLGSSAGRSTSRWSRPANIWRSAGTPSGGCASVRSWSPRASCCASRWAACPALDPEMGADDFILMPVTRRRAGGAAAAAAGARQTPGLAAADSLRRGRARLRDAAGLRRAAARWA